ncbi:hypothetical protein V8C35DRAFT_285257 [Trichoderma chlorosporum]
MRSQFALAAVVAPFSLFQSVFAAPSCPTDTPTTYCDPSHPVTGAQLRSIFNNFVEQFYFKRDFQGALDKYVSKELIQHNPQIANGTQAMLEAVTAILANYDGPEFELAIVDEERGYGVVFNRFIGKEGTGLPVSGVVDVYRFEGSCMVEHWDVIEGLPANSTNPVPF